MQSKLLNQWAHTSSSKIIRTQPIHNELSKTVGYFVDQVLHVRKCHIWVFALCWLASRSEDKRGLPCYFLYTFELALFVCFVFCSVWVRKTHVKKLIPPLPNTKKKLKSCQCSSLRQNQSHLVIYKCSIKWLFQVGSTVMYQVRTLTMTTYLAVSYAL